MGSSNSLSPPDGASHAAQVPAKPTVQSIKDLDAIFESMDPETGKAQYTTFYISVDEDAFFFGQISKAKADISGLEFNTALEPVPDHVIFPPIPEDHSLTIAPNDEMGKYYIKQPNMSLYELFKDDDFIARLFLGEALVMEQITRHPHPNIVNYHGIRVRRDRITGLVLDRHELTLLEHVRRHLDIEEEEFMRDLESAVEHLHSLGLAHNDLNPENIMVTADRRPVLIDFGSCRPFGKRLMSGGTEGWVDTTDVWSAKGHDQSALEKIREWFKEPFFE